VAVFGGLIGAELDFGCYVAAINEVPLVSEFLFSIAVQVYRRLPVLNALHAPQAPILVAALTIGTVFFLFTIPLAYLSGRAWRGNSTRLGCCFAGVLVR
jgi:hypothetical protein